VEVVALLVGVVVVVVLVVAHVVTVVIVVVVVRVAVAVLGVAVIVIMAQEERGIGKFVPFTFMKNTKGLLPPCFLPCSLSESRWGLSQAHRRIETKWPCRHTGGLISCPRFPLLHPEFDLDRASV
jgi:hypothetical protein